VTLQALVEVLRMVADKQAINRMGAENLAIVMAPNLFRPPGDDIVRVVISTPPPPIPT
jgi:hypothetical protein